MQALLSAPFADSSGANKLQIALVLVRCCVPVSLRGRTVLADKLVPELHERLCHDRLISNVAFQFDVTIFIIHSFIHFPVLYSQAQNAALLGISSQ
jgi:hypothetical protein